MDQLVFEILGNESIMVTTSGSNHDSLTTSNGQNGFNQFNLDFFQNSMDYDEMSTNKKVENILTEMVGNNKISNNNNDCNIPPLDSQQQLHNLLAKVLTRKLSWDTNSSHEEINKDSMQTPTTIISEIKEIPINENNKDGNDKEANEYLGATNGISLIEKTGLSAPVGFNYKLECKLGLGPGYFLSAFICSIFF